MSLTLSPSPTPPFLPPVGYYCVDAVRSLAAAKRYEAARRSGQWLPLLAWQLAARLLKLLWFGFSDPTTPITRRAVWSSTYRYARCTQIYCFSPYPTAHALFTMIKDLSNKERAALSRVSRAQPAAFKKYMWARASLAGCACPRQYLQAQQAAACLAVAQCAGSAARGAM